MDPNTRALIMGAGGGAAAEKIYVEDVFSTWLYTGNGSTQTITNGIDLSGKGGLVWIKQRGGPDGHQLRDTARGGDWLASQSTIAQQASSTSDGTITSYNSNGFTLGTAGGNQTPNGSGYTLASWTFRKAAKFFDVVTWVGDGTSSRNISHSLGSTPGFIIVKRTDSTSSWWCWHRSISTGDLSGNNLIVLNTTAAQTNNIGTLIGTASSTAFQVGGDSSVNASGGTYVAYLFAHDAGGFGDSGNDSVIKCGTFSGTGFVDLGWEPQWLLIKPYNQTYNWEMYDNMRGMGQPAGYSSARSLVPNLSNAEAIGSSVSFEATGFTQTTFGSSYPCIYIAIRRGPLKTPTDATKVFGLLATTPSAGDTATAGFPVDMSLMSYRGGQGYVGITNDRLRGYASSNTSGNYWNLFTINTWSESTFNPGSPFVYAADSNTGLKWGSNAAGISNSLWMFRRAPGFFDVVAYTGSNSVTARNHALGVIPQMMIIKGRSGTSRNWYVYHKDLGNNGTYDYELLLNTADAQNPNGQWLVSNRPTATTFTNNSFAGTNGTGETYIAYLFASCPGVSKVGSYTGTGTTLNIDCGFTNGARFVLIKRTDSTGDWYVWDTARGIIAANDPYLLLNSTAAEVTNTDFIDPLSSGFQISSTAPAAINANGGSFIFLAVA